MAPTTYDKADKETVNFVQDVMEKYHGELCDEKHKGKLETMVKIEVLMAANPERPAVTHNGYPCLAKIKIVGLQDRSMGAADARIIIDEGEWRKMPESQRVALIDHELQHLQPAMQGSGSKKKGTRVEKPKYDDCGRPKLKLRKHDVQVGWFRDVARRHGDASCEVVQARAIWKDDRQLFFDFVQIRGDEIAAKPAKRVVAAAAAIAAN